MFHIITYTQLHVGPLFIQPNYFSHSLTLTEISRKFTRSKYKLRPGEEKTLTITNLKIDIYSGNFWRESSGRSFIIYFKLIQGSWSYLLLHCLNNKDVPKCVTCYRGAMQSYLQWPQIADRREEFRAWDLKKKNTDLHLHTWK